MGVGLVRWQAEPNVAIDHPLVQVPAELTLDAEGAFVVRMADAAQATLWPFPGVAKAAPALLQIEACAKDYQLIGASPPAPTDRDAWEPLLRRAAYVHIYRCAHVCAYAHACTCGACRAAAPA